MPKVRPRTYSRRTKEALLLFGKLIRIARKEKGMSAQEAADRASVSRSFIQRVEKGDPKCEIGAVFEIASIVGIQLFDSEKSLKPHLHQANDKLRLLPKSSRKKGHGEIYENF